MALQPFATDALMGQRSRGAITTASHPYLTQELSAASRAIRNACGWHIAAVEELTYVHRGRDVERVWLPAMEITAITKVTVDGVEWDAPATDAEFDRRTGWTNIRGRSVEVEYSAGFETVPADVEALTLELAAGGLGTAMNIVREQALGSSVTFGRSSGALTAEDRVRLTEYIIGRLA